MGVYIVRHILEFRVKLGCRFWVRVTCMVYFRLTFRYCITIRTSHSFMLSNNHTLTVSIGNIGMIEFVPNPLG